MSDPEAPAPPPRSRVRRNPLLLGAALLLVVIAVTPAEIAGILAFMDGLLIWWLFSVPLVRAMTAGASGFGKAFFGALGIMLAGAGSGLLIILACSGPASRMSFH